MSDLAVISHLAHPAVPGALADSYKITGMPASTYHQDLTAQSCSLLKPLLLSPAHFKAGFFANTGKSKVRDFGTLVHTLVLEPHRLAVDYAVFQGKKDGRDTEFKAFVASNANRMAIDELQLREARTLADKMLSKRIMGRPFGDYVAEGEKEVVIYFRDPTTGVLCRVRIDLRHPELLCDLKTSHTAIKAVWLRRALEFGNDMQAYMYSLANCLFEGRDTPLPFYFLVGESKVPHSVSDFRAGESFLARGGKCYSAAIGAYAACSEINHWPDSGESGTLDLEPWMAMENAEPTWRESLAAAAAGAEA